MWKYCEVFNVGVVVVLNVAAGWVTARLHALPAGALLTLNTFVFRVALPATLLRGIGIKSDLYRSEIWRFISVFLAMRALSLLVAMVPAIRGPYNTEQLGRLVIHWLGLTWISTVILGVPVLTAVQGPELAPLGVIAGISSFIFQLPAMLMMLDCYKAKHAAHVDSIPDAPDSVSIALPVPELAALQPPPPARAPLPAPRPPGSACSAPDTSACAASSAASEATSSALPAQRRTHAVLARMAANPVLWSVAGGFVLSLTRVGPKYLDPGTPLAPNPDYVIEAGFIDTVLDWLGSGTSPISLFAMGMWMAEAMPMERLPLFRSRVAAGSGLGARSSSTDSAPVAAGKAATAEVAPARKSDWLEVLLLLLAKLFIVPLIMVPLAMVFGLPDPEARAATLIASLPISLASFSLAKEYSIGEGVMAKCVVLGTLAATPVVIIWLEVMDALDLFDGA